MLEIHLKLLSFEFTQVIYGHLHAQTSDLIIDAYDTDSDSDSNSESEEDASDLEISPLLERTIERPRRIRLPKKFQDYIILI